jgi:hypothetical protein
VVFAERKVPLFFSVHGTTAWQSGHQQERSLLSLFGHRVARLHIFKPKIPIWVIFGRGCNGRCKFILYGHMVLLVAIWYIFSPFGIFCDHLVYFVTIWYIFITGSTINIKKHQRIFINSRIHYVNERFFHNYLMKLCMKFYKWKNITHM